jgi:hypothetical protein
MPPNVALMPDPTPDLPDHILLETIRLPRIMRASLIAAGLRTVGEVRAVRVSEIEQLPDLSANSVIYLRLALGRSPTTM